MDTRRKNSRKRQAILEALCATREHPTAEMLYQQLKPDYPELSLGTVYRNLGVLAEEGLAVSVVRVAGQERYDATTAPAQFAFHTVSVQPGTRLAGILDPVEKVNSCHHEAVRTLGDGLIAACCSVNSWPSPGLAPVPVFLPSSSHLS